jgi:acetyl-CoA carboxylase biotin carboxyl carrier protein
VIADDIKDLIALFNQSDLTELSIERSGRKLFLRKGEAPEGAVEAPVEPPPPPATALLKAHMVGVFYWGKDKGAKPAVALEQHVDKGQIIGFIEAMGIMNELEADRAGLVIEIPAAAGKPVEYGQPIVVLQPD